MYDHGYLLSHTPHTTMGTTLTGRAKCCSSTNGDHDFGKSSAWSAALIIVRDHALQYHFCYLSYILCLSGREYQEASSSTSLALVPIHHKGRTLLKAIMDDLPRSCCIHATLCTTTIHNPCSTTTNVHLYLTHNSLHPHIQLFFTQLGEDF